MTILAVGSAAYDDVITPFGGRESALGGSAIYFSLAAQHFTNINLVAVVGDDFRPEDRQLLQAKKIDTQGLVKEKGKTFFWKGEYGPTWNDRTTHVTDLNVFEKFDPVIPTLYRNSEYVFLGNIAPQLQLKVLDQIDHPKLVVLDTMNFWINSDRQGLMEALKRVDLLMINDSESVLLSDETSLVAAARSILAMGPKAICIKLGEHGAMLIQGDRIFMAPAYPLVDVVDPTGAGDSYAGGFLGYLASKSRWDFDTLKKAVIYGSVMGSYTVESFSVDKLVDLTHEEISDRYFRFVEMTHFHR